MKESFEIVCFVLALMLMLATEVHAADAPARKPNVIFIVADDLGYADAGFQNAANDVKTPNIDAIARNGVHFTNAYVSCPVCSPSRAGLLTGRYQERFGHEHNPAPELENKGKFGLPLDQVTLANEMKSAGYVTGAFGKWHEGTKPAFRPQKRGFDEFYGFLGGAHGYVNSKAGGENSIRRGDEEIDEPAYLTDAIAREAVAFIDHHQKQPFFMYVPFNAVHTPQAAPPKYQQRFADVTDQKRKMCLAMLSALDDGVGRIVGKVRDVGLEENTLIVFLSDNGGPTESNASTNTPLRGYKGQVWEGGIHIPFAMQWKGQIPADQTIDHPIISLDLFPTALAAIGASPDEKVKLDGVNLLPLLKGETKSAPHDTLYWRFTPAWAIRDGNYKLLHTRDGKDGLYDLSKDLGEKNNLLKKMPEKAAELHKKYDAWAASLPAPLWAGRQEGAPQDKAASRDPNGSSPESD
jgi:arylsulfatase A-like enzyme